MSSSTVMQTSKLFLLSFLFGNIIRSVTARCDDISLRGGTAWQALVSQLDEYQSITDSPSVGVLCPFKIEGDQCPQDNDVSGYRVISNLYLVCSPDTATSDHECIINCPNTHFDVQSGSQLTLEGMTLTGSVWTSVIVQSNARFEAYFTTFESNWNPIEVGGAIRAYKDSYVDLQYSNIINNGARFGGAMYSQGSVSIEQSTIERNTASEGAVVYLGESASDVSFLSNKVTKNKAVESSPVVYIGSTPLSGIVTSDNVACQNKITNSNLYCDGVSDGNYCQLFEGVCTYKGSETQVAPFTSSNVLLPQSLPETQTPIAVTSAAVTSSVSANTNANTNTNTNPKTPSNTNTKTATKANKNLRTAAPSSYPTSAQTLSPTYEDTVEDSIMSSMMDTVTTPPP